MKFRILLASLVLIAFFAVTTDATMAQQAAEKSGSDKNQKLKYSIAIH